MTRRYSLAHLTASSAGAPEAVRIAADAGYDFVGLRVAPVFPDAPYQPVIEDQALLRETLAALRDTGVSVFDVEIIRIGEDFTPETHLSLLETARTLGARAVLIAGDDSDLARLADNYAALCEQMKPYELTADLEFMPWTPVRNARRAVEVIDRAGSPVNAGVLVDALHFSRSNTTLADVAAIPPAWLHYVQVCDAPDAQGQSDEQLIRTAREERLLPGEGDIDLDGLLRVLPPDLPVSVEIVNLKRSRDVGEPAWARIALDAVKRMLDED